MQGGPWSAPSRGAVPTSRRLTELMILSSASQLNLQLLSSCSVYLAFHHWIFSMRPQKMFKTTWPPRRCSSSWVPSVVIGVGSYGHRPNYGIYFGCKYRKAPRLPKVNWRPIGFIVQANFRSTSLYSPRMTKIKTTTSRILTPTRMTWP